MENIITSVSENLTMCGKNF
uniref:Uncharacterized protein n=1 Tax=Anguilla anguilla TaxID=7936 RepID=A0A0E9Q4R2_ANGAN